MVCFIYFVKVKAEVLKVRCSYGEAGCGAGARLWVAQTTSSVCSVSMTLVSRKESNLRWATLSIKDLFPSEKYCELLEAAVKKLAFMLLFFYPEWVDPSTCGKRLACFPHCNGNGSWVTCTLHACSQLFPGMFLAWAKQVQCLRFSPLNLRRVCGDFLGRDTAGRRSLDILKGRGEGGLTDLFLPCPN